MCYNAYNRKFWREVIVLLIKIDFNSDEAFYIQVRNQVIMSIATDAIGEGDSLPSVRRLARDTGINMHTVNKAYSLLKSEGFIQLDRRKGAIIAVDIDKMKAINELRNNLRILLAASSCKNITRREIHQLVDEIIDEYQS